MLDKWTVLVWGNSLSTYLKMESWTVASGYRSTCVTGIQREHNLQLLHSLNQHQPNTKRKGLSSHLADQWKILPWNGFMPPFKARGWFHWNVSNFMATKNPRIATLPAKGDDDPLAQWRSLAPLLGMAVLHSKVKGPERNHPNFVWSYINRRNSIDFLVSIVQPDTFLKTPCSKLDFWQT